MHPFSSWMGRPQRLKKPRPTVKISMVKQNYSSFDSCVQFCTNTWCCELQRMQFPLAMQVAIRDEKSGELGTTHFSCANFSEAKVGWCLVLRFLRVCLQGCASQTWQLAMDKYQRKHQIGLDLAGMDSSNLKFPAEKLAKEQKDRLSLTLTDRELNAGC